MRTLIIMIGGLVLWALCLGIAHLLRKSRPASMSVATTSFIGIWFVAAGVNLWLGVTRAGFSVEQELPVFLAVFLLPGAIAVLVKWKLL